jgi:molybdate transport system regulatory protein
MLLLNASLSLAECCLKDKRIRISARNQLADKVQQVTKGAVNAEVVLSLEGGETVVAIITNSSVGSLELPACQPARLYPIVPI